MLKIMAGAILLLNLCALSATAEPLARPEILPVSPRVVALSPTDEFDEVATGLNATPLGAKIYFQGKPVGEAQVSGYSWSIKARPAGSTAQLSATTGAMVTYRPDKVGAYTIALVPLDTNNKPTTETSQVIYAETYAGVGTINTHATPKPIAPQCGTGFCHGGNNAEDRLNVLPEWQQSRHAHKLENHMNGVYGDHYATSCLPCHTTGFDADPAAVNGGFDDVAASLNYDLNQIPALVAESVAQQKPKFPELPAELQAKANIQCESCHGPGSQHPSNLPNANHGIAGADLDTRQCATCHDQPSRGGIDSRYVQWASSGHSQVHLIDDGAVARRTPCANCHTGEGFVNYRVKGIANSIPEKSHGATCSTCHDPHYSPNPSQLRLAGDFTFDTGDVFVSAGAGKTCMACHNSRVADLNKTVTTSYRGAHYGTQGDMLAGINGYAFDMAFNKNSAHYAAVEDTCVHCHMAATPPNAAMGGHTFAMRDDANTTINVVNACQECHGGLATYNRKARGDYDGDGVVEGIQDEVKGLQAILREGILARFSGTSIDPASGRIAISATDFDKLTTAQKGALYDFNFVWVDGSYGVHNASYAVQLLQRAYFGVYGEWIKIKYPKMVLRGPVQINHVEDWAIYG
jgi:hypothetical protein